MHHFPFTPAVDLPLVGLTFVVFLWYFNHWASRGDADTTVDLTRRLPAARMRVVVLFASILVWCWFANWAVWSLFILALGLGLALLLITGSGIGFGAVGFLVRELAFGFPHFIVPPETRSPTMTQPATDAHNLIGKTGVTTSPLLPSGDANIAGKVYSVVSDNGQLLNAGQQIVVTCFRNGRPCVALAPEVDASCENIMS